MRAILAQMDQAMTNQAQVAIVQAKAMTAQVNQDVAPRPHQQVTTMASRRRHFTRMNHPTFYVSKFDEDPLKFLDEI